MSDKQEGIVPYALILGEGIHDVAAVEKILKLWGYKVKQRKRQLPAFAVKMIPNAYPSTDSGSDSDAVLNHTVTHPSFYEKEGIYVAVANAGSIDKLGKALKSLIGTGQEEVLAGVRSIAFLADMDNDDLGARKGRISGLVEDAFQDVDFIQTDSFSNGVIQVDGRFVTVRLYLFPDNERHGTLETVLLDGAKANYTDLYNKADMYITCVTQIKDADGKPKYEMKNYDGDKVKTGVIANVLKPGFANQASIRAGNNNWFTVNSLDTLPTHKKLSDFLRTVLQDVSAEI